MKQITLKGKTLKGKNRVREYGSSWEIMQEKDGKFLVQPTEKRFASIVLRWIQEFNDPDFEWN